MAPMKLAIIGGGPSAFYVASRLLARTPPDATQMRIHMFDRLWAPHGLNCTHKFDAAATDPRFRFFGNVNVGQAFASIPHTLQLPLSAVFNNYTHVVFATGCALPTLHPDLPPSQYCMPALSLVHWYTQHPSCPPPPPLERVTHVSLIGNGNVSLDVARMLLTPVSVLEKYDVPVSVLDLLSRSRVKHVSIFGRRGPLEAAFTTKELRELMNLPDASMVPLSPEILEPAPASNTTASSSTPTRQQARILQLLRQGSKNAPGSTPKTWSLDFFRAPMHLAPPPPGSPLAQLTLAHTALDPTHKRAIATGATSTVSTSLVVTSLGFHAEPQAPFHDPTLMHMRTAPGGRVIDPSSSPSSSSVEGTVLKDVYASGWAATGAKGVLASTMMNAYAVADAVLSDWLGRGVDSVPAPGIVTGTEPTAPPRDNARVVMNPSPHPEDPPEEVVEGMEAGLVMQYGDWKRVDDEEVKRGTLLGKERERMGWQEAKAFLDLSSTRGTS
ncbi:putative NADPH adrenodoxin oxidoreductase, mitochondrial [Lyophyllum shimeji]|uniref:NADPH adrenodoxin oxidoreductase, mitochondrial n=1 Tax=Lyophyllum shimeji TaxID=47721 RepID=A0A9P3PT36_LYOSH|nr:putative NADPH adrenodoxin oxidoreductase, mitochondrial [Lyophyllum shimeji]